MIENVKTIITNDYNYYLPNEKIAKYPLNNRDDSKMLIFKDGEISETVFNRLSFILPENNLLIFNNTRVINARLLFKNKSGAQIEVFCLEPEDPKEYASSFQTRNTCRWKCMIGNLKRWKTGDLFLEANIMGRHVTISAARLNSINNIHIINFSWDQTELTFGDIIDAIGILPIPPYLHRDTEASDLLSYQTVYSKIKGSVAAPTAGLHFTDNVINSLNCKHILTDEITLHVGAGTFKPVSTDTIGEHTMHKEHFGVSRNTLIHLLDNIGNITAVGTTTVRTLESLYYIGVHLSEGNDRQLFQTAQWEPYEHKNDLTVEQAITQIINYMNIRHLDRLMASTSIIIVPGFKFRLVDKIITNFHQPGSTLLLLIAAFVGKDWRNIYNYALNHDFRFLSYGDSSLLFKNKDI